jgi:hypothetical protein
MSKLLVVIPTEQKDVELIQPRAEFSDDPECIDRVRVSLKSSRVYAYTLWGAGQSPVAIVGGVIERPGVMTVWSLTSDQVGRYAKSLHQEARRLLAIVWQELGLHRAQMMVRTDFAAAIRWAEHLGFDREGELREYAPGIAYYIYGRVKPWPQCR